jgi:hypothetical protein
MAQHSNASVQAAMAITIAVTETIREAGPLGAPCGMIYAALMSQGCSMEQYERIERAIVNTGLVVKKSDCLIWNGPR